MASFFSLFSSSEEQLRKACEDGVEAKVKKILESNVKLDAPDKVNYSGRGQRVCEGGTGKRMDGSWITP